MMVMIILYCLVAATLVIGVSLHAEFSQERKRKNQKGPAQVICIDRGRRPAENLHKHA
jgi:hypothetical protein